ncbi:c-type cytochrome [Roseateles sp. GG27B]
MLGRPARRAAAAEHCGASRAGGGPRQGPGLRRLSRGDGNASNPDMPSLAGQPRQFIVQALFMFREGNRKNAL